MICVLHGLRIYFVNHDMGMQYLEVLLHTLGRQFKALQESEHKYSVNWNKNANQRKITRVDVSVSDITSNDYVLIHKYFVIKNLEPLYFLTIISRSPLSHTHLGAMWYQC